MGFANNVIPSSMARDLIEHPENIKLPRFIPAIATYVDPKTHDVKTDAGVLDNDSGRFAPCADPTPEVMADMHEVMADMHEFATALNRDPQNPFEWVEPIE